MNTRHLFILDSHYFFSVLRSYSVDVSLRGLIKDPVLLLTSSGGIGFWDGDLDVSKTQGGARERKGMRKRYLIAI